MEKLIKLIAEETGKGAVVIHPETRLDSLAGDSLEFLELLLRVQQALGVNISDEQVAKLDTVGDLALACGL